MQDAILQKYAKAAPRYTSYPTAPHFHGGIDAEVYRQWLGALGADETLSLYVHIPYCDTLCWFCGCHTKITRSYAPVERYLAPLTREIETVSTLLPLRQKVTHIHWGGGSPTFLSPEHICLLGKALYSHYNVAKDAEFAVEIDPRGIADERIDALARAGVNRASLGIQDFDLKVQHAINRLQSYEETASVIQSLRDRGINSINLDLLYGLPFQTTETLKKTFEQVFELDPDRIALFGYAHVPWMKRHQSMIDESALPSFAERFEQAEFAARLLTEQGYVRVGLDHFAKPDDALVTAQSAGELKRNFQGYTADSAGALIGFGASAIGKLPQGYVQNVSPIAEYERRIMDKGLATEKGIALSDDDRLRAHVIEKLMCDLALSKTELTGTFGATASDVLREADDLAEHHEDGFIIPTEDGFTVTEKGRPFVRTICAHFDPYLRKGEARHSIAV